MNARTSCLVYETSCLFSPTTLLKAPENTKNYGLLQRKALQPMRGQFSCIGQQIVSKIHELKTFWLKEHIAAGQLKEN